MNTLTKFLNPLYNQNSDHSAQYEIIENEQVYSDTYKGITLSGSLFSLSTFVDVTFDSCEFYGTKWENCQFIRCKFINCTFKFSHLQHCKFKSSSFNSCNWHTSPIKKCRFEYSELDSKTAYFAKQENNWVDSGLDHPQSTVLEWSDILQSHQESTQIEVSSIIEREIKGFPNFFPYAA